MRPWELVGQVWSKNKDRARNVLALIGRFNRVSWWVTSLVCDTPSLDERRDVIHLLIEVAQHFRELNNFNGMMEILSGLEASSVHRLKVTWSRLDRKHQQMLEEQRAITSQASNYKTLRGLLRQAIPPCIPFFGMYLTDLTFLEDGNPDLLTGTDLINVCLAVNRLRNSEPIPHGTHSSPHARSSPSSGGWRRYYLSWSSTSSIHTICCLSPMCSLWCATCRTWTRRQTTTNPLPSSHAMPRLCPRMYAGAPCTTIPASALKTHACLPSRRTSVVLTSAGNDMFSACRWHVIARMALPTPATCRVPRSLPPSRAIEITSPSGPAVKAALRPHN